MIFLISLLQYAYATPQYYCTAANSLYFPYLLNLIGSIHEKNFNDLEAIAVFDLGMSKEELQVLEKIQKLSIHQLEKTHPEVLTPFPLPSGRNILGWYAWKPGAIKQALDQFPYVLWLDAGMTVLQNLNPLFEYLKLHHYFLCTTGDHIDENGRCAHSLNDVTTIFVKEQFDLNHPNQRWVLDKECALGGIIGVAREGKSLFLNDLYEMSKDIRYYEDDGSCEKGLSAAKHDQTLLSILGYLRNLTIHVHDYTQKKPMILDLEGRFYPFFMTWDSQYINSHTSIYHSRADIRYRDYFYSQIRTKI